MAEQMPLVTDGELIMRNTLRVRPESRAEYLDEIRLVLPQARQLPGCLRLEVGESIEGPATFHLFEHWRSGTDYLERYLQLPFYQRYLTRTENMYAAPRTVTVLQEIG